MSVEAEVEGRSGILGLGSRILGLGSRVSGLGSQIWGFRYLTAGRGGHGARPPLGLYSRPKPRALWWF